MALETLKGVKQLGGFDVWASGNNVPAFVSVDHDKNILSFAIQNGPVKENGVNGCQVDTLIHAAKAMIIGLNEKFPCRENALAVTKLDEAIHWLEARTKDRTQRNVEGTNQI